MCYYLSLLLKHAFPCTYYNYIRQLVFFSFRIVCSKKGNFNVLVMFCLRFC